MGNLEETIESTNKASFSEADVVDFLDAALVLGRSWRLIVLVSLGMLLAGGGIALWLRPTFTATAVILPPQQQQSAASLIGGQLGALGAIGGGASLFKNPGDLYAGILASNTIADHLIDTFHLKSVYKTTTVDDARSALKGHTTVEAAKDGLILVTVTAHDPHLASDLANGYIDGLHQLNASLAITEAAQRRVFFDQELESEKTALANAEDDLKTTQQKTGLIVLGGQAEEVIRSIAQVRAEIASREVEIQSLKTFATDQNPQTIRVQEEINTLRGQLANLENSQHMLAPGDTNVPAGKVPEATLEYARKLREVRYHESLYELLSNQLEAARIDEAKSAPLIQVIDRAVPPERKSGPHRLLIALGSGLFGFVASCVWVFLRTGFGRVSAEPRNARRLQELRAMVRLSRP
jgi:uncharacterized protein involved in exopolysaccharide biosynthesis